MAIMSKLKKQIANLAIFTLVLGAIFPIGFLTNVEITNAATYTVANLNDDGAGSLRQAIVDANGNPGADIITFNGALSGTITLASNLPAISEPLEINGETANDAGAGPDITLDGTGRSYCLSFTGGSGHQVKGLTTTGCSTGIDLMNVTGMQIGGNVARQGNEMGSSATAGININNSSNITIEANEIGTIGANGDGIIISNGSSNITIGDPAGNSHNTISNNTANGIMVSNSSNVFFYANFIGTSPTGTLALANGAQGILIDTGNTGVIIGGTNPAKRNIISSNGDNGIVINSGGTLVQANHIGVDLNGSTDLGNASNGIKLQSGTNTIGGDAVETRNIISGNGGAGIIIDATVGPINGNIITNNHIGADAQGLNGIANTADGIALINGAITNTEIGGENIGNLISANGQNGVRIVGNTSTGTLIYGNTIGLKSNGEILANTLSGIHTEGDSTVVGDTTSTAYRNIISGNGASGILIDGADSCTIVNNYIGLASDGTTEIPNINNGVTLENTAQLNTIGGLAADALNLFALANMKAGISIEATAGNFNVARKNNQISTLGLLVARLGASNENIASPTITVYTTSLVEGTSPANTIIDIYQDKIWVGSVTADAEGAWSAPAAYTGGTEVSSLATNAANSTSGISMPQTITADNIAPTAPIMTSSTAMTEAEDYTMIGTKEADTNVLDGVLEIIASDNLTSFTKATTLAEGTNTFTLSSKDLANNQSTTNTYTIIRDSLTPAAPTLSFSSTVSSTLTVTSVSGSGTEADADIYVSVNGGSFADSGMNVQNDGTFTMSLLIPNSTNTFTFKIVDAMSHESETAIASISKVSTGGGGGGYTTSSTSSPAPTPTLTPKPNPIDPIMDPIDEPQNSVGEGDFTTLEPLNPINSDPILEPLNPINPPTTLEPLNPINPIINPEPPVLIDSENLEEDLGSKPEKQIAPPTQELENFQQLDFFQEILENLGDFDKDSDGDGISDKVEAMYGSNPYSIDSDGDGIEDAIELINGTNPQAVDTDRDGIPDSKEAPEEINVYNAPQMPNETEKINFIQEYNLATPTEQLGFTDSDKDGLSDLEEQLRGTDPNDADSDGDGLSDGDEANIYGTNPVESTSKSAISGTQITNITNGETVSQGPQVISGSTGDQGVMINVYRINDEGKKELVATTMSDKDGKYNVLTDALERGEHTLLVVTGDGKNLNQVSQPFTLKVVEDTGVPKAQAVAPTTIEEERSIVVEGAILETPKLRIEAPANHKIVVIWQSTVYSQTLIADASGSTIDIEAPASIEPGKHTVTYYSVDQETNTKSEATQISFTVAGTTAFAVGDLGGGSIAGVALGAMGVLAGLIAIAVFFRKRKTKNA